MKHVMVSIFQVPMIIRKKVSLKTNILLFEFGCELIRLSQHIFLPSNKICELGAVTGTQKKLGVWVGFGCFHPNPHPHPKHPKHPTPNPTPKPKTPKTPKTQPNTQPKTPKNFGCPKFFFSFFCGKNQF